VSLQQQPEPLQQQSDSSSEQSAIGRASRVMAASYRWSSMYLDLCIDICQYVFVTICCAPILEERLSPTDAEDLARRFKALADPARLRLLSLIASCGEVCACELVDSVGVSQPTVSHHLRVLHETGLLERERRGKWVHYRVARDALDALRAVLG